MISSIKYPIIQAKWFPDASKPGFLEKHRRSIFLMTGLVVLAFMAVMSWTRAAKKLGIGWRTLYDKMEIYAIQ